MEALESLILTQPVSSPFLRCAFLSSLCDLLLDQENIDLVDNAYETYFARYHDLCRLSIKTHRGLQEVTHADVLDVINQLKETARTREELLENLKRKNELSPQGFDAGKAAVLLDLAASTWLMLPIGHFPQVVSLEQPLVWSTGRLKDTANWPRITGENDYSDDHHSNLPPVKLPQSFTADHLERVAGIQIHWTSNLADHLRLRDDDTRLILFHHASILNLHAVCPHPSSILPPALAEETTRTLALLIPPVLAAPNPWFLQKTGLFDPFGQKGTQQHGAGARKRDPAGQPRIDMSAGLCNRLNSTDRNIEKFQYWRARLELLKRTYDEAEPRTLGQLWNDDRKKVQWFTFWVAVLVFFVTVFFGLIQSIAAVVQAWASVAALRRTGSGN